ncbi:MAG: phage terminase large subunit [Ignavibacteriae bacterium]|nr:phage terminase large subunit [Ignavibacteriota bacterium]
MNMPPRHGKSELISKYFPAWYLGCHPNHNVILVSYSSSFAVSWGRKVKSLINEFGENYFGIKINPEETSSASFGLVPSYPFINAYGTMNSVGAGGPITGKGADLLIIDDPIKNDEEAHSKTIRDNIWDWFNSTALTRLEPDGIIIIIMTRWHQDDLCGRLLKQMETEKYKPNAGFDDWTILNLPAISGENDMLGREPGEPLWEKRFPLKKLESIKNSIGSYWFSALYQQNPSPEGSGIFKRTNFRYFSTDGTTCILKKGEGDQKIISESECRCYATIDLAVSDKETADYTVSIIFKVTKDNDILIYDIIRERFSGVDHPALVEQIFNRWNPLTLGIEGTQYQISLVQMMLRKGYPITSLSSKGDKTTRAMPMATKLENHLVYFRLNASWLLDFEDELIQFPNGTHDDQVDAFAYISEIVFSFSNSKPASSKVDIISKNSMTSGFI